MRRAFLFFILLTSLSTAAGSLLYILDDPAGFAEPFKEKYQRHLLLMRVHGIAASITLILGPLGFIQSLGYHRLRGRIYLTCVLLAAVTGIPMALMAEGGSSSRVGFLILSILWVYTGIMAWNAARQRRFVEHRRWIVRNFALTFGAVVLRAYLHEMQNFGYRFHEVYPSAVWVSWIPVMLLAEALLMPTIPGNIAGRRAEPKVPPE